MRLKVRYFALFKDLMGKEEEDLEFPNDLTIRELVNVLERKNPETFSRNNNRFFAVNREFADLNETLHDGDELAIFPKISGG